MRAPTLASSPHFSSFSLVRPARSAPRGDVETLHFRREGGAVDVVGGDLDIVESVIVKSGEGVPAVVGEADGEGVADNDPSGPVSTISTTALRLELKCSRINFCK